MSKVRIVVLRKPGKPNYALPGAYRPIYLLDTLCKLLEAVMARRLSFLLNPIDPCRTLIWKMAEADN
jgi:hypothetical protein